MKTNHFRESAQPRKERELAVRKRRNTAFEKQYRMNRSQRQRFPEQYEED